MTQSNRHDERENEHGFEKLFNEVFNTNKKYYEKPFRNVGILMVLAAILLAFAYWPALHWRLLG